MYNNFESMKGSLLEQMCAILDKHIIAYEKNGVEKNLDCFGENKAALLNLLSKHPKWDNDSLAIVFDAGDIRVRNEEAIEKTRIWLEGIAKEVFEKNDPELFEDTAKVFNEALKFLCSLPQFVKDSRMAKTIFTNTKVKCAVGQRVSRVVNKLCKEYKVDSHVNYFSVFTALADSLNPLAVENKTVLSLNPCDYLEMTSNHDWFSDFRLGSPDNRGDNIAGTFAFMNDNVSMVLYTVDNAAAAPYYNAAKINSEIFCYENGILLQSRLYPDSADEAAKTTFRNLVQQVFAECLEQPNLWMLKKKSYAVGSLHEKTGVLKNCSKFLGTKYAPTASLLKIKYPDGLSQSCPFLAIGHDVYCVKCGDSVSASHNVYCDSCAE